MTDFEKKYLKLLDKKLKNIEDYQIILLRKRGGEQPLSNWYQ